jgi:hypothetical protein
MGSFVLKLNSHLLDTKGLGFRVVTTWWELDNPREGKEGKPYKKHIVFTIYLIRANVELT